MISKHRGALFIVFLLAGLAMFGWLIFSSDVIWNDYPVYQLRYGQTYRFYLEQGIEPLWYPHIELGMPAGGLVMAQAFHLPAWLIANLPGYWDGSALKLISAKHVLLCLLSQCTFYFGFRHFAQLSRVISFVISFLLVYQLRTLDAVRYGTFNDAFCYFLFASMAGIYFLQNGKKAALLVVLIATQLMLSSGYQPILSYGFFAFVILSPIIVRVFLQSSAWFKRLPAVVLAVVCGFLLAAPHWLPFVDFLNTNAQRVAQSSVEWANEYALVTNRPFPMNWIGYLANLTLPALAEVHAAFGGSILYSWVIIFLFVYLLLSVRRNYLALIIFIAPFIYIAGIKGGLFPILYQYFPTIKLSRLPGRMGIIISVVVFALLVQVIAQLRSSQSFRLAALSAMRVASIVLIFCCGLSALLIAGWQGPVKDLAPDFTLISLNSDRWTIDTLVYWNTASIVLAAAIYLLSADLCDRVVEQNVPRARYAAPLWGLILVISFCQSAYLMRFGTWTRVRGADPTFAEFEHADHLPLMTEYPLIASSVYGRSGYGAATIPAANFYQRAGEQGVVECLYPVRGQHQPIEKNYLPFYLSNQVACAGSWQGAFGAIDGKNCVPQGAVAALSGSPACALSIDQKRTGVRELDRLNRRTRIIELTPNAITLHSVTGVDALLVTPLPFVPGWSAEIDGQGAELLEINGGLIGVRVRPGKHEVRIRYYTGKKYVGYLLAWGTCLLLLGLVIAYYAPLEKRHKTVAVVMVLIIGTVAIYFGQLSYLERVDRRVLLNNNYDQLLKQQLNKWRELAEAATQS